jgi:outer membrane protein OmpA-like peptidoglycan-associated protein
MEQLRVIEAAVIERRRWLAWSLALPLAAYVKPARAQAVKVYRSGTTPRPEEVADILAQGARRAMKQRGVRLPGEPAPAPEPQRATDDAAEASAFAMPIPFAFDSARLEPGAVELLDVVAEGIRLNHGSIKVVVAGHTDAHGRVGYNERLSQRRAEAVLRYFVEKQNLPAEWLEARGFGPHQPLDPARPFAAENRRVQFHAA